MAKKKPKKKKVFEPNPHTSGSACKIGDQVVIQNRKYGPWFPAEVTATHLTGTFACALIQVRYKRNGKLRELTPYDMGLTSRGCPRIVIFPPAMEIPEELAAYAKKHDLRVARKMVNAERPIYRLVTSHSRHEVYILQKEASAADLSYEKGRGWRNGKWEVLDCGTDAVVCPTADGVGEITVSMPEDMEISF